MFRTRPDADPLAPVPGRVAEVNTPGDFRTQQQRTPFTDAVTSPGATFKELSGHKIAKMTSGDSMRTFLPPRSERI